MANDAFSDDWSKLVIGCAIEVHRALGPGFLESVYDSALGVQMRLMDIPFRSQPVFPVKFKGEVVGEHRPDFVVGDQLVVELKAVDRVLPIHTAQCNSYLKATGFRLALLINFNVGKLVDGVKRIAL